jgi:hypothetical protein
MRLPSILAVLLFAAGLCAQIKTKSYSDPENCVKTYRLANGRVLTPRGLIEDPTVNAIMKDAVSTQMSQLKISDGGSNADVEIRFVGGSGAGLQVDDISVGNVAMWDIGGPQGVTGRTYKKSDLVMVAVEAKSNRTIWAARCTDKFGDPSHLEERIRKAVAKAFAKFPKKLTCSG